MEDTEVLRGAGTQATPSAQIKAGQPSVGCALPEVLLRNKQPHPFCGLCGPAELPAPPSQLSDPGGEDGEAAVQSRLCSDCWGQSPSKCKSGIC